MRDVGLIKAHLETERGAGGNEVARECLNNFIHPVTHNLGVYFIQWCLAHECGL